jgi:hypothetical protein
MGSKGATTTATTSPPKSVEDMYKYLTEQGKTLQQQQYQPYTGQLVAPLNEMQQQGLQQVQQYAQTAQPYYQGAAAGTIGAMQGYTPQGFQQGVGSYMSPYLQNAMGSTAAYLENQQAQQRQELLGKTIASGAFGGDRGKIAQAALAGQQNLAAGQLLGQMAQQGYSDASRNYFAGLAGQGALAQQLGALGTNAQTAGLQGAQAVSQAGTVPYNVAQAQNAAAYQQFAQQQAYPFQTLGFLANIASGLGAGQGGTSVTTTPGPNALNQAIGIGTTLASLPWSDKRLKENVKKVGETFDGQPIYSFNYKGQDQTQIGLMAQDVEKRHPEAVGEAGGYKTVDYDKATEDAAERGKFNYGGSSMGGLVPAGQPRQGYATRGAASFGLVPYVDDPLYSTMAEKGFVPVANLIPALELAGAALKIKEAEPYKDEPSEFTKGIQAMPEWQRGNLVKNLKSALGYGSGLDRQASQDVYAYDPSAYTGRGAYGPRGSYYTGYKYASGGLIPRSHHRDGEEAKGDVPSEPFLQPGQTLFEKASGMELSPDARSGLLAAGLGILASRSPFPGVAIGEGGMAGLNTYYNALANRRAAEKQAADIELTREERDIQRRTVSVSELNALATRIAEMRLRLGMMQGSQQGDTPEAKNLENQIRVLSDQLMQAQGAGGLAPREPSGDQGGIIGGTVAPAPSTQAPAGGLAPATQGAQPGLAGGEATTATPAQPAGETAAAPSAAQPITPATTPAAAPAAQPSAAPAQQPAAPAAQTQDFYGQLNDNANPMKLQQRSRAAYAAGNATMGKDLADKAMEEANKIRDTGQGIGKNGEIITLPSSREFKEESAKMADNIKYFNDMAQSNLSSIPKALYNANTVRKILAYYQSGNLAGLKRDIGGAISAIPGLADAVDANDEQSALAAFDMFQKNAIASVFNEIKDIGGRVLVSEIEGLSKATVDPRNQPLANQNVLAGQMAALQIMQDYFDAAVKERERVGYSKFDQSSFVNKFMKDHKFEEYVEKNKKNIAARGATPSLSQPNQFKEGQLYVLEKPDESGKMRPYTARFMGVNRDRNGKPISGKWQVEDVQ